MTGMFLYTTVKSQNIKLKVKLLKILALILFFCKYYTYSYVKLQSRLVYVLERGLMSKEDRYLGNLLDFNV